MKRHQFQRLWQKVVECHQDNRISIGDAYRLKLLLSQVLIVDSVTLRREGDLAVVEIEMDGYKQSIIRECIGGNFHHMVTAEGILADFVAAAAPPESGVSEESNV